MSASPDFRLYHGNTLEVLAGLLAEELRKPVAGMGVLEPDTILIPQAAMRRWLQNALAQAHGVAANLRFLTPGEFVHEALRANGPEEKDAEGFDAAALRWRLYALLRDPSLRRHPALTELAGYLRGDDALKAYSLAGELASVFEKYQAWRRDWLLRWEEGHAPGDWQAELWRRVARGRPHRARRIDEYLARRAGEGSPLPRGLPLRLFVFACINASPDALRVIASQARTGTLHFYLPTPCRNYWGDLRSLSERLREGDEETAFASEENPLLENWGRAGRDGVAMLAGYDLAHPSGEVAAYAEPTKDALLQRLQRDLLDRRAPPAASWRAKVDRADASLQIHACHTRLREVQVLHDQLRALLEADPTLEPRDIAVLAPDIDPYLPHIAAVFGSAANMDVEHGGGSVSMHLPYAVADGSALATLPLTDAFLRLLALPVSRFGVNEVLDLLAAPAIAERFEIAPDALDTLRYWLVEAGARWGLDAAHRERLDAPADAAFTWTFALDRLLLGYAADDEHTIAGPSTGSGQAVAPWTKLEGGALSALDALIRFLRLLARCEREFAQPQPPRVWQQCLLELLAEIAPERPRERVDQLALQRLRDVLEEFRIHSDGAGFDAPVPPEVVRAHFAAALADADARAPFLTGGISFSRMVPMRLIPFRVICVLGMNDGDFPRRDPAGAFNRLAAALDTRERRRGDRSLREDDRFLFLQLLVAANDVFYLSYVGTDPRDGSAREPSVLVGELLDVAARYHANPDARAKLVVRHPLQPFSPQAFGAAADGGNAGEEGAPEPRRFSYHAQWRLGAVAALGAKQLPTPWLSAPLPAAPRAEELSLEALRGFLRDPARFFLRQRLGIRAPDAVEAVEDVEPLALPGRGLQRHRLRHEVFAACLRGESQDALERLRARALLPTGPLGRGQFDALFAEIRPYAAAFLRWRGDRDATAESREFDMDIDGVRLSGRLDDLYPDGLPRVRIGALDGAAQIAHGLDWLVSCALGDRRPLVQFAAIEKAVAARPRDPIPADRARMALRELLRLRAKGLNEPLPFLPRAGWLWYAARDEDGWKAAQDQWHGTEHGWGEATTSDARLALRDRDPFADHTWAEQFRGTSIIVFDALIEGRVAGGAA
jgi:exodeoxyribonuclease V gamma subunit